MRVSGLQFRYTGGKLDLFKSTAGAMSFARREMPALVERYERELPGFRARHLVRPGITGWAQINGLRGETDTLDKMKARIEYDLAYLRNWSLRLDLTIILRTVMVVFKDRHAY